MKRILYSLILLMAVIRVNGQDVKVSAEFDSARIYIGDQINFTITVDQPSGLEVKLPSLKDTINKNIEIVSGPVTDSLLSDGRIKIINKYLVTSFDSGFYQIDPFYAEVNSREGMKRFFSDYTRLEVMKFNQAPADTSAQIYDIIDPYRAPVTMGEILPWVLIAAIAAVLAWGLVRFFKSRRKAKGIVTEVINPDPAHIIAFRELEQLRDEELWQKGQVKQYYTRLTDILRQYLENRYKVYSLELTTSETLNALVKTGFKKDGMYTKLKNVLTAADLVKFAKYKPETNENDAYFQSSWEFVHATKEVETVKPVAEVKTSSEEGKS